MKLIYKLTLVFVFILMNPIVTANQMACPQFPHFLPKQGDFAKINCQFHQRYEARVQQLVKTFGVTKGRAVIMNLGGSLLLKANGHTETHELLSADIQRLKAISHGVFTVYLILGEREGKGLSAQQKQQLSQLSENFTVIDNELAKLQLSAQQRMVVKNLISQTVVLINQLQVQKTVSNKMLNKYSEKTRPLIRQLLAISAASVLERLDGAIKPWLKQLSEEDIKQIGIVVATSSQARADEISIQYFMKIFNRQVSVGASNQEGFVVLENAFDEKSALKILARHYLDRQAARFIFNDPETLQRDVLGPAAKRLLRVR